MLKILAERKCRKMLGELLEWGEVTPDNWLEYKQKHIEAMLLAAQLDRNCSRSWAKWVVFQEVCCNRAYEGMPAEFYADILHTVKAMVLQDAVASMFYRRWGG